MNDRLALGLCIGLIVLATGCVQRRMTIRSNPPGATVYVDDYEVGATPVSANFTYYGTRKIRLVKDGYETLTVLQPVSPPWYQIVPLDLVTENFVPGELRDHQQFSYQLRPQAVVPGDQLLGRAEQLRHGAIAAALPPAYPPTPTAPPTTGIMPPPGQRNFIPPSAPPIPPAPGEQSFIGPGVPAAVAPPAEFGAQPVHSLPPSGAR